jgi:DNA repair protein RAD50
LNDLKVLDLEATRLAIKDLEEYHKALDQALMKYHSDKMSEINGIIRELWQTTYRGTDIDTIEIHAETEKKGNRAHRYRVVMVKGDNALDMRGRCSAGKVVVERYGGVHAVNWSWMYLHAHCVQGKRCWHR